MAKSIGKALGPGLRRIRKLLFQNWGLRDYIVKQMGKMHGADLTRLGRLIEDFTS